MRIKELKRASSLFVALIASGCAAKIYIEKGAEKQDESELAVIYLPDPVHYGAVLERIDGKWRGVGMYDRFRLLPGNRCLTFALNRYPYDGKGKLIRCFNAVKGVVYSVDVVMDTGAKTWNVFIVDYNTSQRVEITGNSLIEDGT